MSDYWEKFWLEHSSGAINESAQTQVLRTLNRVPIEPDKWEQTLQFVLDHLELKPNDRVLDLGGGNGLFARAIAETCQSVCVVDFSAPLLNSQLNEHPSIQCIQSDVRNVEFEPQSFDRVLCYAVLQYLTPKEALQLFQNVHSWLTDDGVFYLGDLPDSARRWEFFNTESRRENYFRGFQNNEPIVGTWFDLQWLQHMSQFAGYTESHIIDQPEYQIYSWFRSDMKCKK